MSMSCLCLRSGFRQPQSCHVFGCFLRCTVAIKLVQESEKQGGPQHTSSRSAVPQNPSPSAVHYHPFSLVLSLPTRHSQTTSAQLSACKSVCLSPCLSVWLAVCLFVCLSVRLSAPLCPLCLWVCLFACLSLCLSLCLSRLSVFLLVCLSAVALSVTCFHRSAPCDQAIHGSFAKGKSTRSRGGHGGVDISRRLL